MMATEHLQSLEMAAQGNWNGAHQLIQQYEDKLACRIHGYLHRVEGDNGNAAYWYRRSGSSLPANSLHAEFEKLYELCKHC
jgi:hypothetical protein